MKKIITSHVINKKKSAYLITMAKTELLYPKNVVAMDFT